MTLRTPVLLLILWSSLGNSLAFAEKAVTPSSSVAIPSPAMTIFKNLSHVSPSYGHEISDMPRIQSQDTVGSCFGCASATIAQKFLCGSDPEIKKLNLRCDQLPPEKTISQLSMVAWADTNLKRVDPDTNGTNQTGGLSRNHTNIKLYDDTTEYSSGSNALSNSLNVFKFMPESCYPFDQLVSKYGNTDSSLFKNIYEKTRLLYSRMKSSTEGKSSNCEECLKELDESFNTTFSQETLNSALEKNTFGEFLYSLLFKNCKSFTSSVRPKFNQIPNGSEEILEKSKVFATIQEVLDKNTPLLINALCLEFDSITKKCTSKHSTVLSGYRKVCPTSNYSDKNCRTQLKIHNCWGADWQKANNDGWVDSEKLIEHLNYGKSYITAGELSWLE